MSTKTSPRRRTARDRAKLAATLRLDLPTEAVERLAGMVALDATPLLASRIEWPPVAGTSSKPS